MESMFCSVRDVRFEIKGNEGSVVIPDTSQVDARILQYIRQASNRIRSLAGKQFAPYQEVKTFNDVEWRLDALTGVLYLPESALVINSTTSSDGIVLVLGTDYRVYPMLQPGINALQLSSNFCMAWRSLCGTSGFGYAGPSIDAIWGVSDDYASAWIDTTATVTPALAVPASTYETFAVSTIVNPDIVGIAPCLSPGMIIRVGSEMMLVIETILTPTVSIKVKRAVNGTIGVVHAAVAPIFYYQPPQEITQATARFAAYPYKRRGDFTKVTFDGVAATALPADIPPDVRGIVQAYIN